MEQTSTSLKDFKELTITPSAENKLKEILSYQKKEGVGLRLRALPGGCAGIQYTVTIEDNERKTDSIFDVAGIKFFIDTGSLDLIRGAIIEYQGGIRFRITNPNIERGCNCGDTCGI
ncbi:MAG: HesB/IscA family protein [Candidatus Hodarchaeota archaeon]